MSLKKVIEDLEKEIKSLNIEPQISEIGKVTQVGDGIAFVSGIDDVMSMEQVTFESGVSGIALNLESDRVGVVVLGNGDAVKEGDVVRRSGTVMSINVSDDILGRVVDPLGHFIDGGKKLSTGKQMLIEKIAPGVMQREPVNQPLLTGIKSIDTMIPIGRGQRELIIGDRQTGKTTIAIDTILNQKGKDMVCVYVAIGQKESKVAQIVERLKLEGALEYTVVVSAGASLGATYSFLAPYSGVAIAEYFMENGKDALIVYDDLSKHAVAYREMSLLLKRPPGREAYPGDVFYLHSRLLERACRRNSESGGGSITALPIVETQAGDISAYVPTNVISITDGQVFLDSNLFYKGTRPAIDVGLSVSRVGGSAQTKPMKKNAGKLKLSMAQYRELESFAQFDSDLDEDTKKTIERGKRISEMLKQDANSPVDASVTVATVYALNNGYFDKFKIGDIKIVEKSFVSFLMTSHRNLLHKLEKDWNDEIEEELVKSAKTFVSSYAN